MLTKTDIQQIRGVVREEIEAEVSSAKTSLESQIRMSRMQVQHDIGQLSDKVKDIEIDVKDVKKRVRKTEKTVDTVIDFFDKDIVAVKKRVDRIEHHLSI
ncbi:MAG: hypothetical protein HY344_04710 [Candidatus Levybacteria bacterium]|nr:hypothetical protein [Candidatus Levybacteria bacterium]